jgi:Tol biopolymer transport system component
MPGYGYLYNDDGYNDEYTPSETGLFLIDLKMNTRKLLVSINDLVKTLKHKKYLDKYWHFVTHSEFSYDGRYVSFLHRWIDNDIKKLLTRLVIYDLKNDNFFSLPTEGMVSHYVWNKRNQIIAYCSIDNISCHVLFDIENINDFKKIAWERLNSDGHQSFVNDEIFITDTYPDRHRMAKLFKVDINTEEVICIASVYSPKGFQTKNYYNHIACDLHPRVSLNGKYICFDSPRTDRRAIYLMSIE